MPDPANQRERRRTREVSTGQTARNLFVALLPVFACFLGGATQKWAEGLILAALGLFLIVQPPRASLGWATNLIFVALLAMAAFAFLPAHWFFWPDWRSALVDDFKIPLGAMVSPQPWISASALVSLIGGMSWLYLVSTQELELRSARFQLRLFVTGIVFIAAISILLYLAHSSFPFWINKRNFGPFPNKNQTADLFGITSIVLLACGQDDLRHGRKRWFLWLIGLSILVTAILLNFSRAGIGILVGGSALWVAVVALRERTSARIALGFSFVLLLGAAVLLLGGQALERFNFRGMAGAGMSADFRWKIFHDTFDLIRASPWCGIGLGNFDAVFAIFRNESAGNTRALHPESDWFWLTAEIGWPAVALIIIGAVLIIRRVLPLQEGTNQRFRFAALLGAMIFAAHGIVDVSGHRVGSAFAGLFLLGLSLHRPLNLRPSRSIAIIFRIVGICLLIAGASWTVAARSNRLLPGSVGVSSVKELAPISNRVRNFSETVALTNRALEWAPLDWQLYFLRAFADVGAKRWANAVDDFRRARFLEPNGYEVPLTEGNVWLSLQPRLAATAWREALRRAGPARAEVYTTMLVGASLQSPEVARILEEVGLAEPDLALAYLAHVSGERFDAGIAKLFAKDPELQKFTEPQRLALFSTWSERGNLDDLARKIDNHPDWLSYAWFGMAKYHASKKDFRTAYDMTERFGEAVAMPRQSPGASIEDLQQRYATNSDNITIGYALYREQIAQGRTDDALVTIRHFTERPNTPAYFHYLEAQSWAAKQNWERAWTAWLAYRDAAARK